jgi:hypothetical protein
MSSVRSTIRKFRIVRSEKLLLYLFDLIKFFQRENLAKKIITFSKVYREKSMDRGEVILYTTVDGHTSVQLRSQQPSPLDEGC